VAAFTVGFGETAVGRYDDALRRVREVRHPAERFNNANSADQQGARTYAPRLAFLSAADGDSAEAEADQRGRGDAGTTVCVRGVERGRIVAVW
jgi:hypothetical protein